MSVPRPAEGRIERFRLRYARLLARVPHQTWFLLLGAAIALLAVTTIVTGRWNAFERKSFDFYMKVRLQAPAPHPDIVLVDIDEHTLAAMAPDYGRWPWPRRVLGEFVDAVEAQGPKAIVLDILFADPDLHNPDSEAAFDAAVRRAPDVFYTAVRLPPEYDAASELRIDRFPGAVPPPGGAGGEAPRVAMILPYLDSILDSGRIGTTNLLPDRDGVAREALLRHDVGGWRIPALPAAVAGRLGAALPDRDRILLNWRGPAGSYRHVSFSDVYLDTLRQTPTRPAGEFSGKIVFVGSSSAGLFDLRPTPVSRVHPGTEILATALDNLLRDDHVRRAPEWLIAFVTAVIVMALAAVFAFHHYHRFPDRAFFFVQLGVAAISFGTLHVMPVYVDASAPIAFATTFFGLARLSMQSRDRGRAALLRDKLAASDLDAHVLWLRCPLPKREAALFERLLARAARRSRLPVAQLKAPADNLGMLERAFAGESGLAWLVPAGADDERARAEIDALTAELDAWAAANDARLDRATAFATIPSGTTGRPSDLRQAFARLLLHPVPEETTHDDDKN